MMKLACVPTSSHLSAMFKWVRQGAESLGAAAPIVEAVAAQVESAKSIVKEIKEIDKRIEVEPEGPNKTKLQDQKLDLSSDLNEAIEESDDPKIVESAAVNEYTTTSKIAQDFGLTSEQESVMHSMGKVVVAAAAGSGKTATLVATIAHLVKEKGYKPSQIMACSFSRAATTELESRVIDRAGIYGCRIGTTHSIAKDIIKSKYERNERVLSALKKKPDVAKTLFKMAIVQVGLSLEGYQRNQAERMENIEKIESINNWYSNGFLQSLHSQLSSGKNLSPKQLEKLNEIERRISYSRGKYAIEEDKFAYGQYKERSDSSEPKRDLPNYWLVPAGQWFNIGLEITMPMGKAALIVDNFKNLGKSVEDIRKEYESDMIQEVALYGAYEWLKENDPVLSPAMDFTDWLVLALKALKSDPKFLEKEQSKYKVLLVDEAQDLNQVQFEMFELLGGKADLLSYIGDDKQSIYGFRGSKPGNYIDLTKKEGYQVKLMSMNFRSGKAIVDAANRLIAHNEDRQIPMVCEADVQRKGMGAIKAISSGSHEASAGYVTQEIKDAIDSGDSPSDFGILVRNHAEHDAYTLGLITRGVPYRLLGRSKENGYFGRPLVKSLVSWMRLIIGGSDEEVNDAVVEAHKVPGFGLDKKFVENLGYNVRGMNFLEHLKAGKPVYTGSASYRNKNVKSYVDAIRAIQVSGSTDSPSLIRAILNTKGISGTFEDALVKLVSTDDLDEDILTADESALREAAMAPILPLMTMAENFKDPKTLLGFIMKMKRANEKVQKDSPKYKEDWKEPAVLIGTVHGWKGLQAKHCYVCMAGGVFPNKKNEEKLQEDVTALDEDRRLAYVAITRGEESVTVVSPSSNYLGRQCGESRFILEACISLTSEGSKEENESSGKEEQLAVGDPKQTEVKTAEDYDYSTCKECVCEDEECICGQQCECGEEDVYDDELVPVGEYDYSR
jgi:superfamily I DNA/RNA helicase